MTKLKYNDRNRNGMIHKIFISYLFLSAAMTDFTKLKCIFLVLFTNTYIKIAFESKLHISVSTVT